MSDENRSESDVQIFRVGGDGQPTATRRSPPEKARSWKALGEIRLFLIVSRFDMDHALTYLFCEGAVSGAHVQRFVDGRPDRFRGSNAVIELAENYFSLDQAQHRALSLRAWLKNVNIIFPPVRLD